MRQGASRPLYPRARGIAPGPVLRCKSLLFQTSFRVLSEERRSRGLLAPRTPTAGPSALHPFCDRDVLSTNVFPHVTWGTGTRAHGRYENVEKSRSGKYTFLPVFSHFPRMHSIRPAVFHTAQPVARRQCRSQLAKSQCSFAKGFLRVALPQQIHKTQSSTAKECLRVALCHRDIVGVKGECSFRHRVQGQ